MPRKQKLSIEEKVELVRQCINGEISIRGAAQMTNVVPKSVRRWIIAYEAEGADAFLTHTQNRVYEPELKKNAVQDYLAGNGSLEDISKKYKIRNPCILESWIKVYNTHGDFNSVKQSGGGSYMRQTRSTTQEERIQIVRECIASGRTTARWQKNTMLVISRFALGHCALRNWAMPALRTAVERGRKIKHPEMS